MRPSWLLAFPVVAVAALTADSGVEAQAPLRPDQFAVGWPLEMPADARIVDVPLTADVYRNASSDDEIAVLDASGRPQSFYRVVQTSAAIEQGVVLDASPVYESEALGTAAEVTVDSGGRRANVAITPFPDGDDRTDVGAFIVDARALTSSPVALDLDWRDRSEPFLLNVSIEQSRTLTDWRAVGAGSIAALSIGGSRLRHARVPVNAAAGGYYRIEWARNVPDWYLERVTLVFAAESQLPRESESLAALERVASRAAGTETDAAVYFDAGGPFPVSSAALDFGAGPGWVRATIASADSLDGPWSPVSGETLFYELEYQGQPLASEPVAIGRRAARYWRVTPAEPVAAGRFELRLDYPAETLRVSLDGTPPYVLVAGTASADAGPDPTFAAVWRKLPQGTVPPRATMGPLRELGGAAALEAPFRVPWRLALLWAVLGVGVLAVAWMAVRLAREFREPST
jgi:hypothetical protein